MSELSVNQLQSNWETYEKLCTKAVKHGMGDLLESLGERLVMCPSSSKEDQYGAYPGGMIEHSLKVCATMRTLNKSLGFNIPVESILKVGLLHDIGKLGDLNNDYFVEQDSSWHREKLGQFYKFNEKLNKMSVSHRSLWLLQHFNISLTNDEWIAIQLAQGSHFEENRFYVGHEPTLALLLQQSKSLTIHTSKG
jgi:putative nucleotidyltransferase with HDIG domain